MYIHCRYMYLPLFPGLRIPTKQRFRIASSFTQVCSWIKKWQGTCTYTIMYIYVLYRAKALNCTYSLIPRLFPVHTQLLCSLWPTQKIGGRTWWTLSRDWYQGKRKLNCWWVLLTAMWCVSRGGHLDHASQGYWINPLCGEAFENVLKTNLCKLSALQPHSST